MNKSIRKIEKGIMEVHSTSRINTRFMPALVLSARLSPWISACSVKYGITPNQLTMAMIPSSFLASFLISFDFLPAKMMGAVLIHIWFAIDLADGEVARYTQNFSAYGSVLDFLAHHSGHFFYISGFAINLYQMHKYDDEVILLIYAFMIYVEYSFRNICSIDALIISMNDKKINSHIELQNKKNYFHILLMVISNQFNCLDNYVLLSSIGLIIDIVFGLDTVFILSIVFITVAFVNNVIKTIQLLYFTYHN